MTLWTFAIVNFLLLIVGAIQNVFGMTTGIIVTNVLLICTSGFIAINITRNPSLLL